MRVIFLPTEARGLQPWDDEVESLPPAGSVMICGADAQYRVEQAVFSLDFRSLVVPLTRISVDCRRHRDIRRRRPPAQRVVAMGLSKK